VAGPDQHIFGDIGAAEPLRGFAMTLSRHCMAKTARGIAAYTAAADRPFFQIKTHAALLGLRINHGSS
jgi:hypothetical protein